MSVYTPINQQQLEQFLTEYSLGTLVDFSGIKAGIQNTNYAVNTTQGKFILTVFESLTIQDLSGFFDFLAHLDKHKFPAPKPQVNKEGQFFISIKGKPAAFFNCLAGRSIDIPSIKQCGEIGEYLAKLHRCSEKYCLPVLNLKALVACQSTFEKIRSYLNNKEIVLLEDEIKFQTTYSLPDLPRGIIHADLFRDNVLFENGHVSGILDFYNACEDYYLFDIAVTCNDWCIENNMINWQKINSLKIGYEKFRKLSADENIHFLVFLRRAALRFWLSRLDHAINPNYGALILEKDPVVFQRLLENYQLVEDEKSGRIPKKN
jgi:homoserine kinase type II